MKIFERVIKKKIMKHLIDNDSIDTRSSDQDIYFETYTTKIGISSMKSVGEKTWNELSNSNKLIKNVKTFRKAITKNILYYPDTPDGR